MKILKNKEGTFVELPREDITFYGNTEEEKEANELIFDLTLENDAKQQELERYKNRIDKAIEMFNNETLNKYYYGMSYEFEINDFKEDMLNILQGSDE